MKIIHAFISHPWRYPDEYNKLIKILTEAKVAFKDYSVPKDDPITNANTYRQLWMELYERIRNCNCFIFFSGLSSTYSDWIEEELKIAMDLGKPIICIAPRGQVHHSKLRVHADVNVGWDGPCIIRAIKDCVRD